MNDWDLYVYSYVPKMALDVVLKEGLYGGEALLKRPDLLALAAKGRKTSVKEMEKDIKKNLSSWSKESSQGPNVVFSLIPKSIKLSKHHPTYKLDLIPIKINISQLLMDYPNIKIFGMELKPYEQSKNPKERHHFLSTIDFFKFLIMEPEEIWSRYNDIDDKGLYAPDVPHAAVLIDNGIIPAKYLEKVNIKKQSSISLYKSSLLLLHINKIASGSLPLSLNDLINLKKVDDDFSDKLESLFDELNKKINHFLNIKDERLLKLNLNKFKEIEETIKEYSKYINFEYLKKLLSEDNALIITDSIRSFWNIESRLQRLKSHFQAIHYSHHYGGKMYIRFGKFPASERSNINLGSEWTKELSGKKYEDGVSVYKAFPYDGKWIIVNVDSEKSLYGNSGFAPEKFKRSIMSGDMYLVTGKELNSVGSDGEPLLLDIFPIKKLTTSDILLNEKVSLDEALRNSGWAFRPYKISDPEYKKISILLNLFVDEFESTDISEKMNISEDEENWIFDVFEKTNSGMELDSLSKDELNKLTSLLEKFSKTRNRSLVFKGYRPFY